MHHRSQGPLPIEDVTLRYRQLIPFLLSPKNFANLFEG
jgi:hypothetical protein